MAGIRDMSTLETPPTGRQAVVTSVVERNNVVMLQAVKSELERGGQVRARKLPRTVAGAAAATPW
eukprot:7260664-Prymnesium_polylepis.1